jgi:hypothetical protein
VAGSPAAFDAASAKSAGYIVRLVRTGTDERRGWWVGGSRAFDGEGWRTPTGYGGSPSLALAATLTEIFARSKRGRPWYKLTAPMVLKGSGWDGDHARGPTVVPFFAAFDGSRRCVA